MNPSKKISLRLLLVLPFILQIFAAVSLTGWLSLRNGQKAVNNVASQLRNEISDRIKQRVFTYLDDPHLVNAVIAEAMEEGQIDAQDLPALERYFWRLVDKRIVNYIQFGSEEGYVVAVERVQENQLVSRYRDAATAPIREVYNLDENGNRIKMVKSKEYDPRTRPWYRTTVKANSPFWSPFYARAAKDNPVVAFSPSQPIYAPGGKRLGVLQNLFEVGQIRDFLASIEIGRTGQTFIIERNGNMVASSKIEQPYIVEGKKVGRISALDTQEPIIRASAKHMYDKFGSLETINKSHQLAFDFQGERQFIQILPIKDGRGVDWLSIVVIPESDFMEQIDANTRTTILLCLAALGIASVLGVFTSNWITQPILRLSQATEAIASGKLEQNVGKSKVNEIDILAQSFNRMTQQLRESFTKLAKTNEQLEIRVEERTNELLTAKDRAEVANKAKGAFLANMSHELRTPLSAILGFTQIMQRDGTVSRYQRENLTIINRSGEHLLGLINDVLDISKIEAGQISLNANSFDLHRLLDTTQEMLEFKADEKGLQLLFDRHPDTPQYIRTDDRKLSQILINLLNNALKFTEQGGITLRVKPKLDDTKILLFEIEDTGAGISPEELNTLFDAFTQTETGRKSGEGTGLGLSISHQFVSLMGGNISASSQLGVGTTFKFQIVVEPPLDRELQHQQSIKKVIGLEPNQSTYRILVVDDRWENRQIVLKLLEPIGFEVKEAINGSEAIKIWQHWQPHLIWMDMRMPVMNGYEATERIKSHFKGQATYIIALTASTFEEERAIVLSAGCDDFVRKPFREEVLSLIHI